VKPPLALRTDKHVKHASYLRAHTALSRSEGDPGVVDEALKAYKNIDAVMAQQQDLAEIVAELKQVVCVKG
jgi:tRNA-splicing ligase RtcB